MQVRCQLFFWQLSPRFVTECPGYSGLLEPEKQSQQLINIILFTLCIVCSNQDVVLGGPSSRRKETYVYTVEYNVLYIHLNEVLTTACTMDMTVTMQSIHVQFSKNLYSYQSAGVHDKSSYVFA